MGELVKDWTGIVADNAGGTVSYRALTGRGTPPMHAVSPAVSESDYHAAQSAARQGYAAYAAWMAAHPALAAWWAGIGADDRQGHYTAQAAQ